MTVASLALALAAPSDAGQPFTHPQAEEIAQALREMMKQEVDRFVIVEVGGSDNYFQYISDGESLYGFDVPFVSLSPEQLQRAIPHFESRGVIRMPLSDEPGSENDLSNYIFGKELAHEQVDEGVRLGLDFLDAVLEYGDRALTVRRGWE